jgi:hypothetical protein
MMSTPARALDPIAVVVTLRRPLDQFASGDDGEFLTAELQSLLADVVADLGLPADLALRLTSGSNLESTTEPPYTITIGPQPARMPPQAETAGSAAILSRQIGEVVLRQRTLPLSEKVCEAVRRTWALDAGWTPHSLSSDAVATWLRRLVAGGWRIDRLLPMPADALAALHTGHMAASRQLEEVIASLPAPGIRVRVDAGLFDRLREPVPTTGAGVESDALDVQLRQLSDEVFAELGLVVDPPTVIRDHGLVNRQFRLQLNDLRLVVHDAPDGATDHSTVRAIITEARRVVGMHAPLLMTRATVCQLLDRLREREPVLVETVMNRFDPTVITWILRDLLEDFVSVRDLRNILEALASVEGLRSSALAMGDSLTMADVEYWSNWIRSELTRQITQPLKVASTLTVHLLAPDLETRVAASDATPLADSERQHLVHLILAARLAQAGGPMVVLTSMDAKRRLRRLIVDELPEVRVIAYQELDPFTNVVPRTRIGETPR